MSSKAAAAPILLLALVAAAGPAAVAGAGGGEDPKDIIAVQLRKQGFPCENPESAVRDTKDSRPDEPVWMLKCANASYRVQMVPGQAAKVEKLKDGE